METCATKHRFVRSFRISLAVLSLPLAWIGACGGGGGGGPSHWPVVTGNGFAPDTGPGDLEHYLPDSLGNEWTMRYNVTHPGPSGESGILTLTVLPPQTILGVSATVISQADSGAGLGSYDNFYGISPGGITYLGNGDPDDPITQHLVPYPQLLFPVQLGTIATITAGHIPMGEDGYGNPVHLNLVQEIVNAEIAPIDVVAGSFPSGLRQVTTLSGTLVDSALGSSLVFTGSETRWFVPGVGLVQHSSSVTLDGDTTSSTAELRGYLVDGVRHGLGPIRTVVDGLSPVGTSIPPEGNPVVASDGTNFLAVGLKVIELSGSYSANWVAQRVRPDGTLLGDQLDLGLPTHVSSWLVAMDAAIVFDGVNYIVVHEQDEQFASTGLISSLVAVRVSPQGTLVGSATTVVPATPENPAATQPTLAFDGTRCLLCFVQQAANGLDSITCVFVSPSTGQADGPEFPITAPGYPLTPALAFNGTDYLAVWAQASWLTQPHGVFATRISTAGAVLDPGWIALHTITSVRPAVGCDGVNFMVLWADDNGGNEDIRGNRISPAGLRLDGDELTGGFDVTSSAGRAEFAPTLTFFDGNYMAAWMSSPAIGVYDGLYGARISSSGTILSPGEGGLPLTTSGFQGNPVLAATSGSALLTWFENRSLMLAPNAVGAVSIHPFGP